jgi:ribosomal protein S27E
MHLVEEREDPPKHARPVRCPHCRNPAPVLLFDSPAVGMVCAGCHRRFMDLRKEAALVPRHLRAHVLVTPQPVPCGRCRGLTLVLVEAYAAGLLCPDCHGGMAPVYEEASGNVRTSPCITIGEELTSTARRAP